MTPSKSTPKVDLHDYYEADPGEDINKAAAKAIAARARHLVFNGQVYRVSLDVTRTAERPPASHVNPEWKWFGYPGHFIGADKCQFHLCTQVGPFLVSTVGCMYVDGWLQKLNSNADSFFETMVFAAGPACGVLGCACGKPEHNGAELMSRSYADAGSATAGHMEMCRRVDGKSLSDFRN